jgi:hypothetical protein
VPARAGDEPEPFPRLFDDDRAEDTDRPDGRGELVDAGQPLSRVVRRGIDQVDGDPAQRRRPRATRSRQPPG